MNYLGFVKEHDNIEEAIYFKQMLGYSLCEKSTLMKIIEYLNRGILLAGWMSYFNDFETQISVAPNAYYTDGIWVWPAYFPYYLSKYPGFIVNNDFAKYLEAKNYYFIVSDEFMGKLFEHETSLIMKLAGLPAGKESPSF